ncbi:MAG: DUF4388 domain-containing protein [Deltaproteobacteria bacterium]|nr:DUF4388 domain-containing protein [Deltaproteobacteria bacterium]
MDIAEKKEEILRLIEKLHPGSPRPAGRAGAGAKIVQHPRVERLARMRRELADIRARREKTGLDLLEERMLRTCQMLEERISRIESILGIGTSQAMAETASTRGTSFARNASQMHAVPQIEHETGSAAQPAKQQASGVSTLSGLIQEGILADLLQLISSNKSTGIFRVESGGTRAEMYLRDGSLYHAACEGMSGQVAFFAAMALESGTFHFEETSKIPEEVTISGNTQFMILEALRQIDEERAKR